MTRVGRSEDETLTQPQGWAAALEPLLAGEDERLVATSHEPERSAELFDEAYAEHGRRVGRILH